MLGGVRRSKVVLTALAVIILTSGPAPHHAARRAPALAAAPVTTAPVPTTVITTTTTSTTVPPTSTVPPGPAPPATACVPDPVPSIPTSAELASPNIAGLGYSNTPGGATVGRLPASTWGGPTVRPVVGSQGGWVEIQLDSRPNGSTGWVPQQDVTEALTGYQIVISTCRRTLTLYDEGQPTFSSPVGVGSPSSPTPLGPSFVDAIVATPRSQLYVYGPTVLITASHSNVYTDFDGGNGTVGIHEYPSDPASTYGADESHGCVRVDPATIHAIDVVPLGTPIDIIR